MLKIIIVAAVIAFILFQVKKHKEEKAREQQKAEERARTYAERKKSGNPSVSTAVPEGAAAHAKSEGAGAIVGADGKEYPNSSYYLDHVALKYLSESPYNDEKYEYSPIYEMLALEYYLSKFEERIRKLDVLNDTDVDYAFKGIYELAENYYYPSAGDDDLTHFMHYEVRYKKDWLRAMKGNGYYQNAYHISLDASKALEWYELSDAWFSKYGKKVVGKGEATVIKMARCKLQAAHILSAGLYGVAKDTQKALGLYGQTFQLAAHYSQEEISAEVICALIQGYPRNPEDYVTSAVNMLADWACRSNLGLAMLIEYTRYASGLDKSLLAQSPESVARLCRSKGEENIYAGYLLGMAMISGYGTDCNPDAGMKVLEAAAEAGSVFAAYALWNLASDDKEKQTIRKKALDDLLTEVCAANGHIRTQLEAEGKNLTAVQNIKIKEQVEEYVENERKKAREKYVKMLEDMEQEQGFSFPAIIHDAEMNRWELRDISAGLARYECMETGEIRTLDRLDIERLGATQGIWFE